MDFTSLRAVLAEWRALLLPSRFEKAQQPSPHGLQIGLRHLQGITWLELSWQAEAARVHAIATPPRQGEGSTLAQQLQHGLRGLALIQIEQPGWERVVKLGFARRPGEPAQRWLMVELMGRHSNLFLLDEERQVVALARQVKASQSRLRPIGTGDPYQPPPPLAGDPPSRHESFESWQRRLLLVPVPLERALREAYQGISPALARQLAPADWLAQPVSELSGNQWHQLWQHWGVWLEALASDRFRWQALGDGYACWPLSHTPPADAPPTALAINRALAAYYGDHLATALLRQRRQQLQQQLERLEQRERRQRQEQEALLAAVPASEELQRRADALLSQRQPERSCIDEAQRLYRKARKLRRSLEAIQARLEVHRQRLDTIAASFTYLEHAETAEQLAWIADEFDQLLGGVASGPQRRQTGGGNRQAGPQPLELHTPSGIPLQVGRNHRQNEWIAFRQARRGDLWFHAQELPGSHVVLKSSEAPAADSDLQSAADLAAHFSRGRANRRVPVVMVPVEQLQRIPGAAPGTVRHRGGDVLWGEPQRALSLLSARQP
ncbi:NFACT family protein [Cyanobium sp. ATX 6A2]|uniref:Rqc2 family fibronectin-binding protein n=1 Tax=Cyanobium sp. ATX 6A2 TaxID=2823700 RepID=UPI0020CC88FA|nr:NFACT RNA binding domain-containing protein [Cyanobium sp. ATX 6A2]MCP9886564.1 NFACT family protein [Cyanobium sp. ATX 6A2]